MEKKARLLLGIATTKNQPRRSVDFGVALRKVVFAINMTAALRLRRAHGLRLNLSPNFAQQRGPERWLAKPSREFRCMYDPWADARPADKWLLPSVLSIFLQKERKYATLQKGYTRRRSPHTRAIRITQERKAPCTRRSAQTRECTTGQRQERRRRMSARERNNNK